MAPFTVGTEFRSLETIVSKIKLLSAGAFGDVYLVYDLKKKTRVIFKTELRTVSIISSDANQSVNSIIMICIFETNKAIVKILSYVWNGIYTV